MESKIVSSLDKVFPVEGPGVCSSEYSMLKNERFHFQVAFYSEAIMHARVSFQSKITEFITLRAVDGVPAGFAKFEGRNDDYVLNHGNNELFPDLLREVSANECMRLQSWNTFWVTVDGSNGCLPVGRHEIKIIVDGCVWGEEKTFTRKSEISFFLDVIDEELPKLQDFLYTSWIHYDCIAEAHSVEPFTEAFYLILGKYLESAIKHGMNTLYTPLFTPSLDTLVGHYRKTVQLVDVTVKENGEYAFGFDKLAKFIRFAREKGIKTFELSHLATQWGAKSAPSVIAVKNGKTERIFGWDDSSDSEEYLIFLDAFLHSFASFVKKEGLEKEILFHISDEPPISALERFSVIKNLLTKHFPNAEVMDALSEKTFFEKGVTTKPFVCTAHYDEFHSPYVYYCGEQRNNYLSNRHFAMPSQRNRILGMQLYRNNARGFLHWGFNFYNSYGSVRSINPYLVTDAGGWFESGDSFLVYPTKDGVLESLRHEVFGDAITDFRVLKLLESYIGREKVICLLDEEGIKEGYTQYPRSAKWHMEFRLKLNEYIRILRENKERKDRSKE